MPHDALQRTGFVRRLSLGRWAFETKGVATAWSLCRGSVLRLALHQLGQSARDFRREAVDENLDVLAHIQPGVLNQRRQVHAEVDGG